MVRDGGYDSQDSSSDDDDYDYDDDDDDDYDDDDDDDDDGGGSLLGRASSVTRGSASTQRGGSSSGSGGSPGCPTELADPGPGFVLGVYPYADGASGFGQRGEPGTPTRSAVRLALEGGYVLEGAGRVGLAARLQLHFSLDLAARYSVFVESVDTGVQTAALGRIGLAWRAINLPDIQLRVGAGLRHFQDAVGGLFGADVIVAADLFLGSPVVLGMEVGGGFVGEALVAQVRGTLGFLVDGFEFYVGYDYEGLLAGDVHVDLGGPMAGIRGWL